MEDNRRSLILWTHDITASSSDVVLNYDLLDGFDDPDSVLEVTVNIIRTSDQVEQHAMRIIVSPENLSSEMRKKTPNLQISFSIALANVVKTPSRASVLVRPVPKSQCVADYMVLYFRDQYISRSDMWVTACDLVDQCAYVGKRISSSSGIRAEVREIWRHGKRRSSAYISASTKPVFRSESARYLIFIQMSKEMWEFEEDGELFYNKAIDGFLPELFKRWKSANAHHLVSIVLFTRVIYRGIVGPFCLVRPKDETITSNLTQQEQVQHSDFYKIVVDSVSSNKWELTLSELKRELHGFQRDVMLQKTKSRGENDSVTISGHISSAMYGNVLEAINLAAHQFNREHIDRDLLRTGTSMIFVTAGSGVFEVDQNMLRLTGENLLGNGIGIDIVSLSKRPLHVTPLFKYCKPIKQSRMRASITSWSSDKPSEPGAYEYILPYICEISYYGDHHSLDLASDDPRFQARLKMHELQMMGLMENEMSTISIPHLREHPTLYGQDLAQFSLKVEQAIELYDAMAFSTRHDAERIISDFANGVDNSDMDRQRAYSADVLGTSVPSFGEGEHFVGLYEQSRKNGDQSKSSHHLEVSPGNSISSSRGSPQWSFHSKSHSPEQRRKVEMPLQASPKAVEQKNPASKRIFSNPLTGKMLLKGQPSVGTLATPITISSSQGQMHKPIVTKGFDTSSADEPEKAPSAIPIRLKFGSPSKSAFVKPRKLLTPIDIGEAQAQSVSRTFRHSPRDRRYSSTQSKQSIAKLSLEKEMHEGPVAVPWHILDNPSDPGHETATWHSRSWRWANVSNQARRTGKVNWESMCAPAALHLTGPRAAINLDDLRTTRFTEHSYSIYINPEVQNLSQKELLREMISQRLDQGYQLVHGTSSLHSHFRTARALSEDLTKGPLGRMENTVFLAHAEIEVHQITCDMSGFMIEVTRYVRQQTPPKPVGYNSLIWPLAREDGYDDNVVLFKPLLQSHNWNYVDQIMSGTEQTLTDSVKFWKARFLIIPNEISKDKRPANMGDQFTDEEIRVAGINKICESIHKATYLTPGEIKSAEKKPKNSVGTVLPVAFTTLYPTSYVKHELQHFPNNHSDSDVSRRNNDPLKPISYKDVSAADLGNEMQSEKGGMNIKDRLWHWRWYEASWVGSEFVTWLILRTDLTSREEATKFAQTMMDKGLFEHVKKQHEFLDGFYLYRLKAEYSSKTSKSWFGSRKVTPIVPGRNRAQSNVSISPVNSPVLRPQRQRKVRFELTRSLRIDVDPHKKSFRPEFVVLHHDIVHNPENCFHIRLEWIAVTARLVEETIQQWARIAEKYGLILVEAPVDEACAVTQSNPFRSPLEIRPSVEPPAPDLLSSSVSQTSISTRPDEVVDECSENKELWFSRILRYWNFVLDQEAAHKFPKNTEVVYSWGRPTYRHTQYIHRTGMSLCQITPKGFLWLTNRLYVARTSHAGPLRDRERESLSTSSSRFHPLSISPSDPDTLRNNFKSWCQSNSPKTFYEDYQASQTPASTPNPTISTPQQDIKSLFDEDFISLHG